MCTSSKKWDRRPRYLSPLVCASPGCLVCDAPACAACSPAPHPLEVIAAGADRHCQARRALCTSCVLGGVAALRAVLWRQAGPDCIGRLWPAGHSHVQHSGGQTASMPIFWCSMALFVFITPAERSCVQCGRRHEGRRCVWRLTLTAAACPALQGIRVCSMLEGGLTPVHTFDSCRDMGFNLVLRPVTGGPIF